MVVLVVLQLSESARPVLLMLRGRGFVSLLFPRSGLLVVLCRDWLVGHIQSCSGQVQRREAFGGAIQSHRWKTRRRKTRMTPEFKIRQDVVAQTFLSPETFSKAVPGQHALGLPLDLVLVGTCLKILPALTPPQRG